MIDHSLLHPTMTDEQLREGCEIARQYDVASVCIKPYAVKEAAEWLQGSDVRIGAVVAFPHGNSTVEIKVAETQRACEDGAVEIDVVVNIGKVLSQEWHYVQREIAAVLKAAHTGGAIVKVIFENDFLQDEHIIKLCDICSSLGVDFVKTSTGYGFVKGHDGQYSYRGATPHHLQLMRRHAAPGVQVKAAGGVRTLDDLLAVKELGVTRVGATATVAILEEAKMRFGGAPVSPPAADEPA
ncbi:deoxyribose-phosphate aldolase [candidate division KSB1 bacterium]|nr:deoxyribose-phosphate aldolase [candidate division KSB1 bacterium]RQW03519.1 MAG: deoxyribose-phosphate aldolase [candidate division KSB1 bacterium]